MCTCPSVHSSSYAHRLLHLIIAFTHSFCSFVSISPLSLPSPLFSGYLESGQKCCVLPGHRKGLPGIVCHTGHVLALAVSSDDMFLVSLCCRHSLHVHVDPLYGCHFSAWYTHTHTRARARTHTHTRAHAHTHAVAIVTLDVTMLPILHAVYVGGVIGSCGSRVAPSSPTPHPPTPPQVSGGGDKLIHVWSVDTCTHLHTFRGHRGTVTVRGRGAKERRVRGGEGEERGGGEGVASG